MPVNDDPLARRERGKRVRWAREFVQPNRAEFARWMGVDTSTIRDIESGKNNPSLPLLTQICHTLRISLEYVVWGHLTGVDGELAVRLVQAHPELRPPMRKARRPRRNNPGGKRPQPTILVLAREAE